MKVKITHKQPAFEIEAELPAVPILLSVLTRKFSRDLKFEKKDLEKVIELQEKGVLSGVNLVVSTGFKENKRLVNGELQDYRHANLSCLNLVLESSKEPSSKAPDKKPSDKKPEGEFVTKKKVTKKKASKKKVTKK